MKNEWLQEALGWVVVKITNACEVTISYPPFKYWRPRRFNKRLWGVCLGTKYIICVNPSRKTLMHEYGHAIQSIRRGWTYLFTVGIVSFVRNIYARIFHKNTVWYYGSWPENEADKLGGVIR